MLVFDCPGCAAKLQVPEEHAGKVMRCPNCQHTATIPSAEAAAVTAEPIAPPPVPPASEPDRPRRRDRERDRDDDDRDGRYREGRDRDERDDDRPRRRRRDRDDRDERDERPKSGGSSVVLVLVLAAVGACVVGSVLLALMIPAVQKVREAAARTQSTNNLKNIALGFHSFHDANKRLPFNGSDLNPPFGGNAFYAKNAIASTPTTGCWGFQILPYIDQQRVYNQVDRSWPVMAYNCPGRGRPMIESGGGAWTDYFYNNYLNSPENAFKPDNPDMKRTLVGIMDGTSNTVFLGHGNIATTQYTNVGGVTGSTNIFLGGTNGTMRSGNDAVQGIVPLGIALQRDSENLPVNGSWGGPFPQGALMAMGDATVRMFPYNTANFGAFLTPTGGEMVILPDF